MPKPVGDVGEGHEDASGNGVYCFIRDLIVEGKDARFVNKKGRYVINWSRALKCYHNYKSKRNPQYKSRNINRRKASNGLRAALLNFYKKEGAKEYPDGKKVNDKNEVVERQFQMPCRMFESLFGSNLHLSDDSSEHETSSIASETDEKPLATPNSSDTGFDDAMDISDDAEPSSECALDGLPTGDLLCSNVKTEEDQVDSSEIDITTPCQMFGLSQEDLDSALGEICSSSDNDVDLLGVVQDICPSSGSVKGGLQFYISLTEELSEDDKYCIAHFDGISDVSLERLNCYTLAGIIPASQQPGPVPVTVNTQDGHLLGKTCFLYVDETQEVLKQLVKDPALQSLYFAMLSQEHRSFGSDGSNAQSLGSCTLQDQGSSIQGSHAQALKVLQLLVYTAAQTNAQQFIQMIFSTSAGRVVFNAYKDRPQLPEDVARANGHDDLVQYLQDVTTRLSKESSSDAEPNAIDWLELVEAVNKIQKQSSVIEDETDPESEQSKDEDNQSDYFADAETSSCGSFELEIGWSDSEDGEDLDVVQEEKEDNKNYEEPSSFNSKSSWNFFNGYGFFGWLNKWRSGDATTSSLQGEGVNRTQETLQRETVGCPQKRENTNDREEEARRVPSQVKTTKLKRARKWLKGDDDTTSSQQGASVKETQKVQSFGEGISTESGTQKSENANVRKPSQAKRRAQRSQWSPFRRALLRNFFLLTTAVITVLCLVTGIKLGERQLLHWAVRNGNIRISQALTKFVSNVDAQNFHGETPLHVSAKNGYRDLVELLMKLGSNANSKDHQQNTPLHLAALNGHKSVVEVLIRNGSDVNMTNCFGLSPLHWAAKSGHQDITEFLLQRGSDVMAQDHLQRTPLHLAAQNGYEDLAEMLIQHGSDLNARDHLQRTPLHLAARNGYGDLAEMLIQRGSDLNARDHLQQAPLHLAARKGHENVFEFLILAAQNGYEDLAEILIQHGSDVNARDHLQRTPLHLAAKNGYEDLAGILIQHGGDVNARDHLQRTPLHLAAQNGYEDLAEMLIQRGSDLNARDHLQQAPLHLAAKNGYEDLAGILIQHGGDVNARDHLQRTPLHLAAQNGYEDLAEILIQHGSDVNTRDHLQRTPLHLAAQNGYEDLAEILIQHGSDVNTRDHLQRTPIHLAARNGHENVFEMLILASRNGCENSFECLIWYDSDVNSRDIYGQTPLHLAAQNGFEDLAEILIQHGSNVNARDHFQQTPLHLAARNGYENFVEILIRYGSDVNSRDISRQTPLHLAAQNGYENFAENLIRYESAWRNELGETPLHVGDVTFVHWPVQSGVYKQILVTLIQHGSDVNVRDHLQLTPLHLAARNGNENLAEILIRYGSDVNAKNHQQHTPLHLAALNGHKNLAEVLIRYGSDVNVTSYLGESPLHRAAESGHQEITEFNSIRIPLIILETGSKVVASSVFVDTEENLTQAPYDFGCSRNKLKETNEFYDCKSTLSINRENLLGIWMKLRTNVVSPSDNQTPYEFDPKTAPVIRTATVLEYLENERSLEDQLEEEFRSKDFFAAKIFYPEFPFCFAPLNLSMALGNVSSRRDYKLKLNKLSLSLSHDGGDTAYLIKYQDRCETAYRVKCCSLVTSSCIICPTISASNERPNDRDDDEEKMCYNYSSDVNNFKYFIFYPRSLELYWICSFENAGNKHFLSVPNMHCSVHSAVLCPYKGYKSFRKSGSGASVFQEDKQFVEWFETFARISSRPLRKGYEEGNVRERDEGWKINTRKAKQDPDKFADLPKISKYQSGKKSSKDPQRIILENT